MRARASAGWAIAALVGAGGAGAALAEASEPAAPGGGALYVARPGISRVSCIRRCASRRRARPGSTLKIQGHDLESVDRVLFYGAYGRADDVEVRARSGSPRRVQVRVPLGATTGPVAVRTAERVRSNPSRPVPILPPPPPSPNPTLTPAPGPRGAGAPRLETGTSRTRAFYAARRAVVFSWRLSGAAARDLELQLVRASDGAVVRSWRRVDAQPGVVYSVAWSGQLGTGAAPQGRYFFRLTAQGANGSIARSAGPGDYQRDAFDLYANRFPILGRHDYGGAGGRFGAPRAGHTHQGQDVTAACGTRLVAARGGRVQYSGYHRTAGNYIVIDAAGTSTDYVYMHLAQPSPFRSGDRVYSGQLIGVVGQTGDATGCHLHFELWSGGWYEGGQPFDPLPSLLAWDSWS